MIARVGGVPCKFSDFSALLGGGSDETVIDRIRSKTGYEHALTFPSGRAALCSALEFAGVGDSDEVLVPGYTCHSVDRAVKAVAEPVYVDITDDFSIDVKDAVEKASADTAAIVPVHMFGKPADMDGVSEVADEYDLTVVEDAAHALGTTHVSDAVGSQGDYCFFSFRFSKEITAFKGGLLLANRVLPSDNVESRSDPTWLLKLGTVLTGEQVRGAFPGRMYHSIQQRYLKPFFTSNSDSLGTTAPVEFSERAKRFLGVQYEQLAADVSVRKRNAALYDRLLSDVKRPETTDEHSFYRYSILLDDRNEHRDQLQRKGIGCSAMYSYVIAPTGECPNAESISQQILNLPVHGRLPERTVRRIAGAVSDQIRDNTG